MNDHSCIRFLQWALPHLHLQWPGFRKVRGQVCKRLGRRLQKLQLPDLISYRLYLEDNPPEWPILDRLCRITISRFYRDRKTFEDLQSKVLPELIERVHRRDSTTLSCWCIGAASGEEPYTVSLLWSFSGLTAHDCDCTILATEADQLMINRALEGCYPASSIREIPNDIRVQAFTPKDDLFCLKLEFKKGVKFLQQDIRNDLPEAAFDLIFCRNLVLTYFSIELQKKVIRRVLSRLSPGGVLVIGSHEELPGTTHGLAPWLDGWKIYRKVDSA